MTDTHTHLYMPDVYPDGGVGAVERAIAAGVGRMVFPCVNLESLPAMNSLHDRFPEATRIAIGLHPTDLTPSWEADLDRMEEMLEAGGYAAVGETGIDFYHDRSMGDEQRRAFARQLGWAQKHDLPVIIHSRDGLDLTLDTIAGLHGSLPRLIFHSFTGTTADVEQIRSVCNPWFGINGVATFKNAPALREAIPEIGLDSILLETDSPWLSPAPHRGKTNESARIPHIRDCVAATLGTTPEEVERITDRTAASLFGFPA